MPCGHHLLQRSHNPNCMVSHLLKGSYIYVHKIQPELAWVYASVKAMVGAVRWEGNSFKCHDGTVSSIPKDTFANRDALIELETRWMYCGGAGADSGTALLLLHRNLATVAPRHPTMSDIHRKSARRPSLLQ